MARIEDHPLFPDENVPLFIAAGPLKEAAQLEPFLEIEESQLVPALTIGGFTEPFWYGNAKAGETDFVYYPDRKMAGNARGLPNGGKAGVLALRNVIKQLTERNIVTIIQVTNLPHEKPIDVIPRMVALVAEIKPTAVEVNLSCPNGKKDDGTLHPPTCNSPDISGAVMAAARYEVGSEICLGAKDSPHVASVEEDVHFEEVKGLVTAIRPYIDFLVGINTIGNQPFPEITCAGGRGGMSGPVVAPIARQHLQICQEIAQDLPYLSCGGVDYENAGTEIPERQTMGAMRVGGAQEFYRAAQPHKLILRWIQAYLTS